MAPPPSSVSPRISTASAPLSSARNRATSARRSSRSAGGSNRRDGVPAIDRNHRTGDVGAGRRNQEQHRAVEILGPADSPQRHPGDQSLPRFGSQKLAIEIGLDI